MMSVGRGVAWALVVVVVEVVCSTTAPASFGGSCEDRVIMCGRWAATGWCQTRQQYMLENCSVSCNLCTGGSCKDRVVLCGSWAATGWCKTRQRYMKEHCPDSCRWCEDPNCFDRSSHCALWAQQTKCQTQEVLATCPRSCFTCRVDSEPSQSLPIRQQTITNPNFECGRAQPVAGSGDSGSGGAQVACAGL